MVMILAYMNQRKFYEIVDLYLGYGEMLPLKRVQTGMVVGLGIAMPVCLSNNMII